MNDNTTNQNTSIKDQLNNEIDALERFLVNDLHNGLNKLSVRPGRSVRRKSLLPNRIGISKKIKKTREIIAKI